MNLDLLGKGARCAVLTERLPDDLRKLGLYVDGADRKRRQCEIRVFVTAPSGSCGFRVPGRGATWDAALVAAIEAIRIDIECSSGWYRRIEGVFYGRKTRAQSFAEWNLMAEKDDPTL